MSLPPIERTITVPWTPAAAFERFTAKFGEWWPVSSHSIGENRVARVVFETREGGLIFEQHRDGRRFQWGCITAWDPPRRVAFTWHPSRDPRTAQDVEVTFTAEGPGTRVTLISTGWERWGDGAKGAHRGYNAGWGYILNVLAGRRTWSMRLLDVMMTGMKIAQAFRGGLDAAIAKAEGEIPAR